MEFSLAATVKDMSDKQAALSAQMSKYKEQKSVLVEAVRTQIPLAVMCDRALGSVDSW